MSDNPGTPQHDEPSAAELDHVRGLLAELGQAPAPPAVVARLERVLESQLPAAVAVPARRRRPWVRRAVLGALPVAAIVAGALVVSQQSGSDNGSDAQRASGAPEALSQAAAAASAAAPAPLSATDGATTASGAASSAASAPPADTVAAKVAAPPVTTPEAEQLREAALDAYRETRRILLDRRSP